MNLITTSSCNKNCSFCFASNKDKKIEFDLEDMKSVIRKSSPEEAVKLLGGEPTLYSHLSELLDFLLGVPNRVVLISNFLTKDEAVRNALKEFQKKKPIDFLINVAELTEPQYLSVVDNLLNIASPDSVSLGITINMNMPRYHYITNILSRFNDQSVIWEKIKNIRVSVPFPNFRQDNYPDKSFYLYHNYQLTQDIVDVIQWGMKHDRMVSIDCGLFPCMFENESQKQYIMERVKNLSLGCTGGAFDIFNKGKASLCYPANDIEIDLNKHDNLSSAFQELIIKKKYVYAQKDKLPQECQSCEYFLKECKGPCLGFIGV